jgi:hypothetical protein
MNNSDVSPARLALLERRLAALELAASRAPAAVADVGPVVTVWADYAGALGDAVKLVSGVWSAAIDSDSITGPVGVVVGISSGWAEIQVGGPRAEDGPAGSTYYLPATAGPPTATNPGNGWVIEWQISAGQRLVVGGGGGAGGLPIDGISPNGDLTWHASVEDTESHIALQHSCGGQARMRVDSAGVASLRVLGCDGDGFKLDPDGLVAVSVTDPGTEEEVETPNGSPLGLITVQACVDGVTKTLHLLGYADP